MFRSIALIIVVAVTVNAQLAFRTDANSNSFSYQIPSAQTTFTRFFGGHQSGQALEAAEARQPQQQVLPAPQGYSYAAPAEDLSYQQNQLAQQQYQQQILAQQQQQQQQQAYSYPQQQPLQQQAQFTQQDIAAYFQQQQELQNLAAQQQYAEPARQALPQQQNAAPQQQYGAPAQFPAQPDVDLLAKQQAQPQRIQYSPSNEVSNVNFASGDLKYNF